MTLFLVLCCRWVSSCCCCLPMMVRLRVPYFTGVSSVLFLLLLLLLSATTTTLAFAPQPPNSQPPIVASSSSQLFYKKVFVAGGTRGVGRCIVDQLLADTDTEQVVCLVRSDEARDALEALNTDHDNAKRVQAFIGDALDQKTVENCMDGCDAAITTLGGTTTTPSGNDDDGDDIVTRVDYIGNNNVIESAGILGIPRVILVTSVGCGSSRDAAPASVFEALKDVLEAKTRAEQVLIKYYTNLNWTIIRPGGLKSEPATGKAILTEDTRAIGTIHRADVAQLVLRALDSPQTERKVLTAVDPTIESSSGRGTEDSYEPFALE